MAPEDEEDVPDAVPQHVGADAETYRERPRSRSDPGAVAMTTEPAAEQGAVLIDPVEDGARLVPPLGDGVPLRIRELLKCGQVLEDSTCRLSCFRGVEDRCVERGGADDVEHLKGLPLGEVVEPWLNPAAGGGLHECRPRCARL
jgi:hypothetical protein